MEKDQGHCGRKSDGDQEPGKDGDRILKSCKVGGKLGSITGG